MALAVQKGKWTDIDYLNGYFVQRGEKVGVNVSANVLVMSMVKAKQAQQLSKIESYVPWDETSKRLS
jgi:cytochrome b translational activator protein CBS2